MAEVILSDPLRRRVLATVHQESGGRAWIGAGFVRNPVWDGLFGVRGWPSGDLDVVLFSPRSDDVLAAERKLERRLQDALPDVQWQVRDQARMHLKHGHAAYRSLEEALSRWPETATALAVRLDRSDRLEICAPFGLDDLFGAVLRPTRPGADAERLLEVRAAAKGWADRWPGLSREPARDV